MLPSSTRCLVALIAASFILGGVPAASEEPTAQTLSAVERALEHARARESALKDETESLERETAALRRQLIAAAHTAQEREEEVSALESRLDQLGAAYDVKVAALGRERTQMIGTLGALTRIALMPPVAAIVMPMRPIDTVRGGLLLRAAVPSIEERAHLLKQELDDLAALRREISIWRDELNGAVTALRAERDRLDALLERKASLVRETEAEREVAISRIEGLAAEATNLRELLERLGTAGAPVPAPSPATGAPETGEQLAAAPARILTRPDGIRSFTAARGQMIPPVRGPRVRSYGQDDEFGQTEKGITLETRPAARVVAPFDGQIVFAGEFRRYGPILIIEHGEGYHSLLAGLSRLDAVVGQWVLAGEPVGLMGPTTNGRPRLYVELRRRGRPVNPVPWLAARND